MSKPHPAEARAALEHNLWTTIIESQRGRNGSFGSGAAQIELELVLAALANVAARVVMMGAGAARRMKLAACFDNQFMDEHRAREIAIHDR